MAILVNGIEVAGLGKGVPKGGAMNQILIKKTGENYDTMWENLQNSNIENGEGEYSVQMIGDNNNASGSYSTAFGNNVRAIGECSHAEGVQTIAEGDISHAEGYGGYAFGDYSHAEGAWTQAKGPASHAEGDVTKAEGEASHAEGGYAGHPKEFVDDINERTVYVYGSYAFGDYSHAEGQQTYAGGIASHSEGLQTGACGVSSHAEGRKTKASGDHSHAEGDGAMSSGYASHAEGQDTVANGECQHAQGRYNIADDYNTYAHIVGNGSSTKRSNAHTLDWEGNAWFAGNIAFKDVAGIIVAGQLPEESNDINGKICIVY